MSSDPAIELQCEAAELRDQLVFYDSRCQELDEQLRELQDRLARAEGETSRLQTRLEELLAQAPPRDAEEELRALAGQFDQAQAYYKKALDQDPRNAGLKRNYSRFVEFYQSFKPDQPGEVSPEEEPAATAGDGDRGQPLPTAPIDQPASPPESPVPPSNLS